MRYAVVAFFALSSLALTQNSPLTLNTISSTAVQVLYVADTANLYTFDIDPQTFQPSLMGTIPLPKGQLNGMAASSDGKFLYLMASDPYPATNNRIYVYDTTGYGVPGMPLQSVVATNEYSMVVDPTGKFLYAVHTGTANPRTQTQPSSIFRYQVEPTTGRLAHVVNEATYQLPVQGTNYCSLSLAGMNPNGTEIYDNVFCSTHGADNGTDDKRTVDPSTGALGQPQILLQWDVNWIGNADSVQFAKNLMFDFEYPIANQPYNELRVYRLSNPTKPLIACTASMLSACGSDSGMAHPSAKYVFYTDSQTNTEVDAVDLSSKQIVPTGTNFTTPQPNRLEFSPDGSIVYSWGYTTSLISIFGFNASTAGITAGGSISESNTGWILAATRH